MNNQKILGIAVTPKGRALLQTLGHIDLIDQTIDWKAQLPELWQKYDGLVFCLALGAVVRLIAPLLQDKHTDPAIVVVDEAGQFVISACGGHIGGADRLAQVIAAQLGATAVITSASTQLDLPAIDTLGTPFGWQRGAGDWTKVSAAIARQELTQVIQESGSTLWQQYLSTNHPFYFGWPEASDSITPKARVWISHIQRQFADDADYPKVQWHPRVLWIGIGCERGTSKQLIDAAITQVCLKKHLSRQAIAGIATIDLKADEVGILELIAEHNWSLRTFTAAELERVKVPNPSAQVAAAVGTPSVAEAAAILAVEESIIFTEPNQPEAENEYLIAPKYIYTQEGEKGAVTVAIALSPQEFTGRRGALYLVGIGPGALEQITPAAKAVISRCDAVVGYSLYTDLISPLLRNDQIIETFPITQEKQRALRAVQLAKWGLDVAVISSGDCGIYGMAGLVLEELQQQNWDGIAPHVEVLPGITALQATASRVGAPLMHDFCAISLSDLLTPLEVIKKRLVAAAQADFVTAFYNPRSATRTEPMAIAYEIFKSYRSAGNPVALVKSAFRPQEEITLTTLGELDIEQIDMFTTVLIGNSTTRFYQNKLITPRRYEESK